jgi:glycine dehydrogenase subunit 1
MGPEGLRGVAELSVSKAHYLAERLQEPGFELRHPEAPFLWEFSVEFGEAEGVARAN